MKKQGVAQLKKKAEWRVVKDTHELYEVSSLGEVRSWRKVGRYAGLSKADEPRYLTPTLNKRRGYLYVGIELPKRKNWAVHRLVAEHFLNQPAGKTEVNHVNGNKLDNSADNLEWCTGVENKAHARANGLIPAHDWKKFKNYKLTPELATEIRQWRGVLTYEQIAANYGVKYSTIAHVMTGRRWKQDENS